VEYEALGEDFQTRGRRSEEQIEVLRLLWTQEVVTYSGRWHQISHAGINPRPIQQPIPIWIGSGAPQMPLPPEAGMRRIARLADGWFPLFDLTDQGRAIIARIRQYAEEAGRDPGALGLEGRVNLAGTGPDDWIKAAQGWEAIGATHLSVSTGGKVFQTPREHMDALRRFKHEVGL
jgi:alkanesulfonate monooxygenase SsuD/methylene tetrahydromethanopterin reductase-like flavin-dependent oxidoreductase (luciferase family)